ncbi:MAG: FG-GAP-like repeat-containing protein [Nitrospira sp.]|nr:FG-GAP-like repeat-containing protein [Nitrospira sp.]HMZ97187.1 RHS repeat-associated core domain-containing protein [Nitrospira sp.]HNJ19763.1 RHS repeat-associated core domain-containing protein [Nitrospira sp.]HNK77613.1 RHS repeat-associated core domain-containing protein [Nitrospira sp.]HNM19746.1 RHS repeat-associated core domain-containing protein [Nitrospira sp.]
MRSTYQPIRRLLVALAALLLLDPGHGLDAKETDTETPIGAVGGSIHGDPFTGTATASIPIEIPPGRNGVQPGLQLVYSHSNGNGWIGMGWKLELGSIERQSRFGVDYAKNDYTIQMSGMSTELVQAPLPASSDEYRAKFEGSFSKIKMLSNGGFEVTDKKGTKYLFGQSGVSRVSHPTDSSKIYKWLLDRVEDRDGNFMTATYSADQGQEYLSQITYTGNGAAQPGNTIKFYLESRPDGQTLYTANFQVITAQRLKTIEVLSGTTRLRAYKLAYSTSASTGRSVLTSVQQFGKDAVLDGSFTVTGGTSLPPVSMTYENESMSLGSDQLWGSKSYGIGCAAASNCRPNFAYVDMNADGRTDFIYQRSDIDEMHVLLSTGSGFGSDTNWGMKSFGIACAGASSCQPAFSYADMNGDGKTDFVYMRSDLDQFRVMLSTGTAFSTDTVWGSKSFGIACAGASNCRPNFAFTDVNGDGKADFVYQRSDIDELRVLLSTGIGFSADTNWGMKSYGIACAGASNCQPNFAFTDLNGDGKADFVYQRSDIDELRVMLSTGTAFGPDTSWGVKAYGIACAGASNCIPNFTFADINGDGKADFVYQRSDIDELRVMLSTGTGFATDTAWGMKAYGIACAGASNCRPAFGYFDVNGDGKADFVYQRSDIDELRILLSTGSAFRPDAVWGMKGFGIACAGAMNCQPSFSYVDTNGDGKGEFAYHRDATDQIRVLPSSPDGILLATMTNGTGGAAITTYAPSTQFSNTLLPYTTRLLTSTVTCDNWGGSSCVGLSSTTTYTYSGGYHHLAERDFRGFNYAKVTGPVGPTGEQLITETWFHQGNDVAVDTNNPNVANGYTKGMPYRSKVTDATGKVYSETTTTYIADVDGAAPFFTPVAQVDASIENGAKQTRSVFAQYDAYGNVLREDQYGDLATTADDRTVVRTFANNTTDWLLGFPTSETSYAGIGTTTQVAQTNLYYDGTTSCATASVNQVPTKGHVTRTVRWLNGGTSPETRMAYDAFGNLTCTRDALGQTSTVNYDSTNTFVKTATNPLGHVVTTQYYGVDGVLLDKGLYGQVKSLTDSNSQTTTSEYDALGRKSKTTTPDGLTTTVIYNYGPGFTVGTQHVLSSTSGAGLATALTSASYFDGLGRGVKKETPGPDSKTIVTEVQYDSRGAVRKKSLPYFKTLESVTGRWATTSYDALGRVVRMDSPDGTRGLACFTDWVTVTIDAADHRKRETKDAYGRTIRVDEYQGTASTCDTTVGTPYATTTYQYDVQGNLLSVTDARGNVSTMTYDTLNRKTAMHDPDMGNWSYVYDANGNLTKQTDAKAQILWFRYDALNRRVQKDFTTQKALGAGDVRYTYDGTTNNRKGRLQQVVDASGTVVFQYDGLGRISQTDKTLDGTTYTTQSTYDGLGRLLTVTYPSTPSKTISYAYNGPVLDKVFEGTTTYIQYTNHNALGQAGTTTYGNGVSTTTTYANANNTICSQQNFRLCTLVTNGPGSGGGGGGTSTTYSALADFSGTQGSRGWYYLSSTGTQLTWNGSYWTGTDGYLGLWNDGGHPGNSTDAVRRWVAPSAGSIQITGNTFDGDTSCGTDGVVVTIKKNGAVLWTQTIAAGNTTGFTFNLSNSVVVGDQIDFVINKLTTSSCDNTVFTPTIVLTTAGGGSGPLLNGTYTAPASTVNLSTEGTVDWTHWGLSTATSFNHKSGVTSQISNFSAVGGGVAGQYSDNLVGYTWTGGTPTASATNSTTGLYIVGVNKGFQFTVPADTTQRTVKVYVSAWGAQGKMEAFLSDGSAAGYSDTSLSDPGLSSSGAARVYTFTYRAASANQTLTLRWTNLVQNDPAGGNVTLQAATLVTTSGGGSSGTAYQDLRYVYGLNGNVNDIYDNLVPGGAGDQHLSYDGLDRLTLASGPYGTNGATASLTCTYDELGNLTFNSQVGTYAYPASGSSSVRPHAVTTAGSNTYSYDANGNLTSGAGRSLTYNLENKPLTVVISGQTTTFVYDGDGGRVKKIAGTTTTRYISKFYECDNTSCSRMVFAGGQRIATIGASGSIYYYHTDHLGSSSVITDSAGAKAQAVTYFPYGATRTNNSTATPAIDVPYKYTGKELDSSTNLYYYEARYYDPTLGRFLSADTLVPNPLDPQSLNRYSYVHNNPFKYTDPTGHFKINVGKFLRRSLGDLGTGIAGVLGQTLGNALYWSGNPILGSLVQGLGTAMLTQSKSGRYVLAGEIIVTTVVLYSVCPGCDGGAAASFIGPMTAAQASAGATAASVWGGAAAGAIGGAALGGYSAAKNGGDISSGVLFGATIGAASGALGGGLAPAPGMFGTNLHGWLAQTIAKGLITNFGSGAISSYAGGKGNIGNILMGATMNAALGTATTPASDLFWGQMVPEVMGYLPATDMEPYYINNAEGVPVRGPEPYAPFNTDLGKRLTGMMGDAGASTFGEVYGEKLGDIIHGRPIHIP